VSSSGIVDNLPDEFGGGDDGDSGEGSSNDVNDDFSNPDFDHLEESLRNFVLQKRALSKLQPAKTYLTKLFGDIQALSTINQKIYLNDKNSLTDKLNQLTPSYESSLILSVKTNEKIEKIIESTSKQIYDDTRDRILSTLSSMGDHPIVQYYGLFNLFEYITSTQNAITERILESVRESEDCARKATIESISSINKIGQESLGDDFKSEKVFREDFMFTRRRDTITRHIDDSISILDFFDPSLESFVKVLGFKSELTDNVLVWKNSLYSVGIYAASKFITTGTFVKGFFHYGSFFSPNTLRLLAVPIAIGTAAFGLSYLISDIPNALPRNLAKKIRSQIKELDYPHQNSQRISNECRKILKIPSREVQNCFQTSLDKYVVKKDHLMGEIKNADMGYIFFGKLLKKAVDQRELVESYDLESISVE
jgi:mitofusin